MSPPVEMLTLLNRNWKFRFLMRLKRVVFDLDGKENYRVGRTDLGSGRPRGTPLRGKEWRVARGRPRGTPLRGLGKIRKWEGRCGQGEGGMGPRMREDNGGGGDDGGGMGHIPVSTGAGSPWEQREGKGFSLWNDGLYGDGRFANRPYGRRSGCMGAIYFHSNHGRGRPRGTPLRGGGGARGAPTGEFARGTPLRGRVEMHEGRPYGGRWKGRARGTPLRGKVERAPTRDAPTGEGVGKVELRTTGFLEGLGMT